MTKPLEDLSLSEMQDLIKKRYETARCDGTLDKIAIVAMGLGSGGRYCLPADNISVKLDSVNNTVTVYVGVKTVCSTVRGDEFIIPGDWVEKLLSRHPDAMAVWKRNLADFEEMHRKYLLEKIQ